MSISDREQMARNAWARYITKQYVNRNLRYVQTCGRRTHGPKYDGIKIVLTHASSDKERCERFKAVAEIIKVRLQGRTGCRIIVEVAGTKVTLVFLRSASDDGRPWWQKLLVEC